MIAGIVGGVVGVLVILSLVIFLIARRKRRHAENGMRVHKIDPFHAGGASSIKIKDDYPFADYYYDETFI